MVKFALDSSNDLIMVLQGHQFHSFESLGMVLLESLIHFALGNPMGKAKATGNLILRTSQGQSLKLTVSPSHCEPPSGFYNCVCDLLTCLIPSGGNPFFKAIPCWSVSSPSGRPSGAPASAISRSRDTHTSPDSATIPWDPAHRQTMDLEKYTNVTK